jgi:uncharacterized cupin superfamily protein
MPKGTLFGVAIGRSLQGDVWRQKEKKLGEGLSATAPAMVSLQLAFTLTLMFGTCNAWLLVNQYLVIPPASSKFLSASCHIAHNFRLQSQLGKKVPVLGYGVKMTAYETMHENNGKEQNKLPTKLPTFGAARRAYMMSFAMASVASVPSMANANAQPNKAATQKIEYYEEVSNDFLAKRGVSSWPIWESSSMKTRKFDYTYDKAESVYILEGEAFVTPKDGRGAVFLRCILR